MTKPKEMNTLAENPSPVEVAKDNSDHLRGTISAGLADDATAGLRESDTHLLKFHGIYQQDDRDIRAARDRRKLEPDHSFMIRLRVPGGLLSAAQWLAVSRAAEEMTRAGSLRLTTRQTLQFHGVPKEGLRPILQKCDRALLDSIAACGDVNRNVMCAPHRGLSPAHDAAQEIAAEVSARLLPQTRAYHEIWLGEERVSGGPEEREPLYGKHYLPRKFKIAIAIPPSNDVDVFAHDIGFIADVSPDRTLRGFTVAIGGGLGMTHGDARTFPRLGSVIGFCAAEDAAETAFHIAAFQRDHGDRSDRKQARLKYTVERLGLDFAKRDIEARLGKTLAEARPFRFDGRGDSLGWNEYATGQWRLGLFVENGRMASESPLFAALREVAALECCAFSMTPNQNVSLVEIAGRDRARVANVFARRGLEVDGTGGGGGSGIRENAMACVAFPTCPLAMAESERYMPSLLAKLEVELGRLGLEREAIVARMTGCPNGCARPYLGEIGLVGKSPGRYNLYIGASFSGERVGGLYRENLDEAGILSALVPLLEDYAARRADGERFGDFAVRSGHARENPGGADFHG